MTANELKHWLTAASIAMVIAIIVALVTHYIGERTSRHHREQGATLEYLTGKLDALTHRVEDIENQRTAATAKRYTSDDAARDRAAMYACIKDRRACPE